MRVADLKLLLDEFPNDAFVVIGDEIVHSLELENGRDKVGYMNDTWLPLERGNRKAIRFTKLEELSDGHVFEVVR